MALTPEIRQQLSEVPEKLRRKTPLGPNEKIPVGCTCDPPKDHGPHYVEARRVLPGGDLRGRVYLGPVTAELVAEAEKAAA
jgi:hypothetical protein